MDGFVSAFLTQLKIERQASGHTIRSYEHDLGMYCRYLSERSRGGSRSEGGRPGTAASLFGLADGAGLCRQHCGPSAGQSTLVLSVSSQARAGWRPTRRPAFVIPSKLEGYLDCFASMK